MKYAAIAPTLGVEEENHLLDLLERINTAKPGSIVRMSATMAEAIRKGRVTLIHADGRRK